MSNNQRTTKQRYFKICLVILFSSILLSVIFTHSDSNLWPGLNIFTFIAIVNVVCFMIYNSSFNSLFLVIPVLIGVFIRTYTYLFPASLIGNDPSTLANLIQGIIATGSVEVITANFYSDAALFHILGGITGLVAHIPATRSMIIYPVLGGVIFPLITFLFTKSVFTGQSMGQRAGLIAGLLASVGTVSVAFSYQPHPQLLATMLWLTATYIIVSNLSCWDNKHTILISILFTSIIFTHKLPLPLTTYSLLLFAFPILISDRFLSLEFLSRMRPPLQVSLYMILLSGCYVAVEYVFMTQLVGNIVYRFSPAVGETAKFYTASYEASKAVAIGSSISQIIIRRLHGLVLLPAAGLAWAIIALFTVRGGSSNQHVYSTILTLATVAAAVSFMSATLFSPISSISVSRFILVVEPLLIATVVVGIFTGEIIKPHVITRKLKAAIIVILVFSQIFSGIAISPDYPRAEGNFINPDGGEKYLSKQTIESKKFGYRYVDQIYTDHSLAIEIIPSVINEYNSQSKYHMYRSFQSELFLSGKLKAGKYEHVLLRNKDIFMTSRGLYRITWNPQTNFDHSHNKIYSNRVTSIYDNPSK